MIYFLYLSVGYLLCTSLVLWMNKLDFSPLLPADDPADFESPPLVSICIPARNEEDVIERAVQSVLRQTYPNVELLVLDDKSTDATSAILGKIKIDEQELLTIMTGKNKPDNWLGKSWACHQLSKKASGDILFFLDADAWLEPEAISRAVKTMDRDDVDFITVWPMQKLGTFWEKLVIPIVYYGLLSLLPARYVHRTPNWIPPSHRKRFAPRFAAACGQCMIFKKEAYYGIGGHQSVKNEIVEDVALAKQIKKHGYSMRMYHGEGAVHCRMYTSGTEMWQGFRKNFLALYNNSVLAFSVMALLNFIVYVVPFLYLPFALAGGNTTHTLLCFISIFLIYAHRVVLAYWYQWSRALSLTHPLGVLWFHTLGVQVLTDYFKGNAPEWKNRPT